MPKRYRVLRAYRALQRRLIEAFPAYDRWGAVRYARRAYAGYSDDDLYALWDELAAQQWPQDDGTNFLGRPYPATVGEAFFRELAGRDMDESVLYRCIEGRCTIWWNERTDRYVGGMGPAGCPCNDVRDLKTKAEA